MIVILYQHKFGGTDLLLQRLSIWLMENKFAVMTEADALEKKAKIDLLVLPTSEMHRVYGLSRDGLKFTKMLVWSMGHGAFKAAFYNAQFKNFLWGAPKEIVDFFIRKYVFFLLKTNSILFTDLVGLHYDLDGVDVSGFNVEKLVYPIAISDINTPLLPKINKKGISVGWVGRISRDFKILPLIKLIKDLKFIVLEGALISRLVIVGDGDGATLLKELIAEVDYVEIDWIKEIDSKELVNFINKKIDVLFAMGTSALDGANAYTPTVIVQPFSLAQDEPKNGYRWIYESKGFSLGEYAGLDAKPKQVDVNINCIFEDIEVIGLNALSKQCKAYSENFLENNVFSKMFADHITQKINMGASTFLFFLSVFYDLKVRIKRLTKRT